MKLNRSHHLASSVLMLAILLGAIACEQRSGKKEAVLGGNAATLEVTSEPSGATIVVDGKARGASPQTFKIRPGQHSLVLRKSGYFTLNEKLYVGAKRIVKKHLTLVASH